MNQHSACSCGVWYFIALISDLKPGGIKVEKKSICRSNHISPRAGNFLPMPSLGSIGWIMKAKVSTMLPGSKLRFPPPRIAPRMLRGILQFMMIAIFIFDIVIDDPAFLRAE